MSGVWPVAMHDLFRHVLLKQIGSILTVLYVSVVDMLASTTYEHMHTILVMTTGSLPAEGTFMLEVGGLTSIHVVWRGC